MLSSWLCSYNLFMQISESLLDFVLNSWNPYLAPDLVVGVQDSMLVKVVMHV